MSGLRLVKNDSETWLGAALRYAKPWGLEEEIREAYEASLQCGCDEGQAAFDACYEWDILELSE